MAKIAFILLTHKDPKGLIAQARRLTDTGDYVSIHFDARASDADFAMIRAALKDNPGVTFAARRLNNQRSGRQAMRAGLMADSPDCPSGAGRDGPAQDRPRRCRASPTRACYGAQ